MVVGLLGGSIIENEGSPINCDAFVAKNMLHYCCWTCGLPSFALSYDVIGSLCLLHLPGTWPSSSPQIQISNWKWKLIWFLLSFICHKRSNSGVGWLCIPLVYTIYFPRQDRLTLCAVQKFHCLTYLSSELPICSWVDQVQYGVHESIKDSTVPLCTVAKAPSKHAATYARCTGIYPITWWNSGYEHDA